MDEQGKSAKAGYLVLREPWPAMLRGIWGDSERYVKQYWSRFEGLYFTSDGAKRDEDGYFWLLGRVDEVMNISGHRGETSPRGARSAIPRPSRIPPSSPRSR